MNLGAVCGGYVANATFTNNSGGAVTVVGKYKSGASNSFVIPAGAMQIVENEIDHGTWKSHDAVLSLEVTTANGTHQTFNDPSNGGVQLRQYTIHPDHHVSRDD